ncbi:hypothetical protein MHYP_G00248360 [Metynnis hypsauchen]
MSQSDYDGLICFEELNRADQDEMVVVVYECADAVRGRDPNTETEDTNTKRILQTERNTAGSRNHRLTAVRLGLLCVLLLTAITVPCNEELDRGERVEMVVDIYESADAVRGHEPNTEMEDTRTKKIIKTQHSGVLLAKKMLFNQNNQFYTASNSRSGRTPHTHTTQLRPGTPSEQTYPPEERLHTGWESGVRKLRPG